MSKVQYQVEQIVGSQRALCTHDRIEAYCTDESGLGHYPPDVVALVESSGEIAEIMRLAATERIAVTPRGLGTGMTGGALAVERGIIISTEKMNRVVELDPDNLLAIVEPGLITGDFQRMVEAENLFYPPDPASLSMCSLGGNVAENAGGPRAFKYGVTREYVLGLDLTLIGGTQLHLGRKTVKGVTGYDVTALIVGSEGTLGLISQITLKLLPKPAAVATFLAEFSDAFVAGKAVSQLIANGFRPRTLELMDQHVVAHLRVKQRWPVPANACALLLVELDGDAEGLDAQLLCAAHACEAAGARQISVASDEGQRRQLWDMRRMSSPSLKDQHRYKISEDIVVPRSAIPVMLQRLDHVAAAHDVLIASFGHAGDGNLHVNVLMDDEKQRSQQDAVLDAIFHHTLALGGTLSGEHGIGLAKKRYMPLEQSTSLLSLQRELKKTFDPHGLVNPGKIWP